MVPDNTGVVPEADNSSAVTSQTHYGSGRHLFIILIKGYIKVVQGSRHTLVADSDNKGCAGSVF